MSESNAAGAVTPDISTGTTDAPVTSKLENNDVVSTPAPDTAAATPTENGKAAPDQAEINKTINEFEVEFNKRKYNLKDETHKKKLEGALSKAEAADKKFQEASYMRKQSEDFIKLLKTNPEAVLNNPAVGLDVQKWAEDFLWNRMQEAKKSPEQREAEENKRKLAEYQEREKQATEKQKQSAFEAAKEQYKGKLTEDIVKTLAETNLPKSARTVSRMAHYILQAKQNGWSDVSPRDVVDMVREDYVSEHNELLGQLPQEELLKILSKEVREKIRKAELWALKHPGQKVPASMQPTVADIQTPKKGMSKEEYRRFIDERTRGME